MAGAQLPKLKPLTQNAPPPGSAGHLLMHGDTLPLPSIAGGDRLKLAAPQVTVGKISKITPKGMKPKAIRQPAPRISL